MFWTEATKTWTRLDTVLRNWTPFDPLTLRDLLNGGIAIFGRTGSGKTSFIRQGHSQFHRQHIWRAAA